MCDVRGKVMRDDLLKRHMNSKHSNIGSTQDRGEKHFKVEESSNLLVSFGAKLKFELHRDNEVYQKNVKIGEKISNLLKSYNIPEKSPSEQNKFCLDLIRAQKPTT